MLARRRLMRAPPPAARRREGWSCERQFFTATLLPDADNQEFNGIDAGGFARRPSQWGIIASEGSGVSRVREDMGLTNLKLISPFCRRPEEGRRSNDLTQLVLAVDRDCEIVAGLFGQRTSGRYDRNREDRCAAVSLAHGEHRTRREAHDALGDAPEVTDAPSLAVTSQARPGSECSGGSARGRSGRAAGHPRRPASGPRRRRPFSRARRGAPPRGRSTPAAPPAP